MQLFARKKTGLDRCCGTAVPPPLESYNVWETNVGVQLEDVNLDSEEEVIDQERSGGDASETRVMTELVEETKALDVLQVENEGVKGELRKIDEEMQGAQQRIVSILRQREAMKNILDEKRAQFREMDKLKVAQVIENERLCKENRSVWVERGTAKQSLEYYKERVGDRLVAYRSLEREKERLVWEIAALQAKQHTTPHTSPDILKDASTSTGRHSEMSEFESEFSRFDDNIASQAGPSAFRNAKDEIELKNCKRSKDGCKSSKFSKITKIRKLFRGLSFNKKTRQDKKDKESGHSEQANKLNKSA